MGREWVEGLVSAGQEGGLQRGEEAAVGAVGAEARSCHS